MLQLFHEVEDPYYTAKFTSLLFLLFDLCWTLTALIDVILETKLLHFGFGD